MDLLTGEPLALDLLNTRASCPGGEVDSLDRIEDFEAWLALQSERLATPSSMATSDLAAVRELREHIRTAVDAARHGDPVPATALQAVNQAVRAAPAYRTLESDLGVRTRRDGDGRARLLTQLAEAAVDLLSDPAVVKVRACEGPLCRMLFLPAHPRRRWCSPALCGNRVRVARHYQRHKSS
ncbi:ABATE domain-containing protein [Nonomuraea sp. NPDC049141]|uniref:CGNR zinc finger domain-containing protein n=1 Tax=Nonomuraea sp. NPDC049141 TaxID=3155500 RepID=UPI0033EA67FB